MEKYAELCGRAVDGRPLIHLVEPGTRHGLSESAGLEKTASGEHMPEVLELIESIQPQPDRLYLVNSALGSGEWVGFNLRGDWFTERGLTHEPAGWKDIPVWDIDARRRAAAETEHVPGWGALAWGYPTFYNANRFRHHVNQDPNKTYGYILGAFWDARMHRVVLVSELVRALCVQMGGLDIYDRIARGEFPDTSIGIKVPYDRDSICNHLARTPADYCEHVHKHALPPYGMRAILPDGRMCGVYNDYPRGFDDSFVFIGAERSAKVLADMTARVRGTRAYTNRLYQPGLGGREARADTSSLPRAEQERQLAFAVESVHASRTRGPVEHGVADAISRCLSTIPAADEKERKALQHAAEKETRRAARRDGTVTDDELRFWEASARDGLHSCGVEEDHEARALALLRSKLDALGTPKLGSLAKWATLTKEVPVPSSAQSALVRDHASRLTSVLPRAVLDGCAESPDTMWGMLSQLAHIGVVLRPDEFQDGMSRAMGAPQYTGENMCRGTFVHAPLDPQHEPAWTPAAPDPHMIEKLLELVGPALRGRSFAPRMVAIRISSPPPVAPPLPSREGVQDPFLNRIAQLYNEYRTGLLTRTPDWNRVPAGAAPASVSGAAKLADAAGAVSSLLLHLAYW